jgi:signal transduction histidine kinase
MTAQWAEVGTEPDLAAERAALRKVATFVARDSSPHVLFAVVVEQVAEVFDVPHVGLVRYDPQGSVVVAGFSETDPELVASRRRIVAASDDARRRIERDLHDGVQQHLVSLGLDWPR